MSKPVNRSELSEPVVPRIDRRVFLRRAGLATFPLLQAVRDRARGQALQPGDSLGPKQDLIYPGLIVREKEPANLEFPFPTLDGFIISNERFFVRSHFGVPKLGIKEWKLKVEGAVERPLELTYDELLKMQSRTFVAMLECAGNGRVFLTPKVKGVAWELGAVGNAEWTGVPLAAVLERVGVKPHAAEVVLEGADGGEVQEEPKSPGKIHFARSLPLQKAMQPEVVLAHRMNGVPLPPAHGFPVRAVVAGWYGMASVKWLKRIVVTERPFHGYYQSIDYSYFERRDGLPTLTPVTELGVKAQIARPAAGEVIATDKTYRVHGAAWTGESEVTKVEVSTDRGQTWAAAKLLDKPVRHAWRLWEFPWRTPAHAGQYTLMARATDARGRTQPLQRDPDHRTYMIGHILPVGVEVR